MKKYIPGLAYKDIYEQQIRLHCPDIKCGGEFVHRNGPYGEFYGCSNFPKCRMKRSSYSVKDEIYYKVVE